MVQQQQVVSYSRNQRCSVHLFAHPRRLGFDHATILLLWSTLSRYTHLVPSNKPYSQQYSSSVMYLSAPYFHLFADVGCFCTNASSCFCTTLRLRPSFVAT